MPFFRARGIKVLLLHSYRDAQGNSRQRTLHRFASSAELRHAAEKGWEELAAELGARYPSIHFDWGALRQEARELTREVQAVSPVSDVDEQVLSLRRSMRKLGRELWKLRSQETPLVVQAIGHDLRDLAWQGLNLVWGLSPMQSPEERNAVYHLIFRGEKTDGLVDEGQRKFSKGQKKAAEKCFAQARSLEPCDPDVLNSEAICWMEEGQLKWAEALFLQAIWLARHQLPLGRKVMNWGELEVRPFVRAVSNLGLLRMRQERWAEAMELYRQSIEVCPDDVEKSGYYIGECLHRLGKPAEAMAWYRRSMPIPEVQFGLALALWQTGHTEEAIDKLIDAFESNVYIAPLLLGREVARGDVWHVLNTSQLDWAQRYVEQGQGLWPANGLSFLRRVWDRPEGCEAVAEQQAFNRQLKLLPVGKKRSEIVHGRGSFMAAETRRGLVAAVAKASR
jgi:tetratricopeptide (TPR) repeat protein